LLLNSIQSREAHTINQTLAVADTSVSTSDVSSISLKLKTETLHYLHRTVGHPL